MKDEFNHVEIDGKEADDIQVKMDDVVADAEAFAAEEKTVQPERSRRGGAKPVPVMEDPMSDEDFNEELKELMEEDTSGKKKKKKKKNGERGRRKKWSGKKKVLVGVAIAVVVIFGASKVMGGGKAPQMMASTFPLTRGEVVEMLSVSGPVEGTDSVEVVSNLHAEILEIPVKEGDRVEKDQLLATLDEKDAKKEVDIAQNAYDLAVTTYNEKQIEAENGYAKAKQDYDAAKANYDRTNVLFQSGSARLDKRGEEALGKLAEVLNKQTDIDVFIEGHTDNKPINTVQFKDNWDLSVIRATSVVRILIKNYGVNPLQIQPSGRGEYMPVDDNETAEGRSKNRRTEIIMAPKLDKLFQMLQTSEEVK